MGIEELQEAMRRNRIRRAVNRCLKASRDLYTKSFSRPQELRWVEGAGSERIIKVSQIEKNPRRHKSGGIRTAGQQDSRTAGQEDGG